MALEKINDSTVWVECGKELIKIMSSFKLMCASVESLTGGGFGAAITRIPGSSVCYAGGLITYNAEQKIRLAKVPAEIIDKYTVYSHECAQAMAQGGKKRLAVDIAISFTGVAGPGSDQGFPPGTVFIALAADTTFSEKYHFIGNRDQIRQQTIAAGCALLLTWVQELKK